MSGYPKWVNKSLSCLRFAGRSRDANAFGRSASFACGCFTSVELSIDDGNIISEARFSSNGCGYMIAAANDMLGYLNENDIIESGGFEAVFYSRVSELQIARRQCVEVVSDAIRAAFADRRDRLIDEFHGDDALICTCFGVGETSVREAIYIGSIETVDGIAAATNAGAGCGSCRMLIQEILDSR